MNWVIPFQAAACAAKWIRSFTSAYWTWLLAIWTHSDRCHGAWVTVSPQLATSPSPWYRRSHCARLALRYPAQFVSAWESAGKRQDRACHCWWLKTPSEALLSPFTNAWLGAPSECWARQRVSPGCVAPANLTRCLHICYYASHQATKSVPVRVQASRNSKSHVYNCQTSTYWLAWVDFGNSWIHLLLQSAEIS